MGFFGGLIGRGLGYVGEKVFGKTKGIDGQQLGDTIGSKVIPFKKGGKIRGPMSIQGPMAEQVVKPMMMKKKNNKRKMKK